MPDATMPATPNNADSETPTRWRRLCADLQERIRSGALAHGARLPSEHELCRSHGLSRITVRRALHELETLSLIRRRQGVGSEVIRSRNDPASRLVHVLMAPEGHFFADLHQALVRQLSARDLSHCTWTPEMLDRTGGLGQVAAIPACGAILIPLTGNLARYEQDSARLGRTVRIGVEAGELLEKPCVSIDFASPCRELMRRAHEAGIRSVLHVTFRWPTKHREGLAHLLMAACLETGQSLTTLAVYHLGVDSELATIRAAIAAVERPALVFCASDFVAVAVQSAVAGDGPMPSDLVLAGVFNTPWSQAGGFTSIACKLDDLAGRAIDLLLGTEAPTGQHAIPGELALRGPVLQVS